MSWRAIDEDDVATVLSGPELDAVRRVAGNAAGEDADQLGAIIATVTDECRARIEDNPENRVGAAGTLPERVIHSALAIVRYRLLTRLNMVVSDARTTEYRDAVAFFRDVAAGKVKIESPDAADVVVAAPVPTTEVLASGPGQMTKTALGGLF